MRLDPKAEAIIVPGEIDGPETSAALDMLLDTGATYLTVTFEFAELLGYKPGLSAKTVRLMTANEDVLAPLIRIQRIRVLGMEASAVDALCVELPGDSNFDGLLGLSFLRLFDVDVHFRQGVLNIR